AVAPWGGTMKQLKLATATLGLMLFAIGCSSIGGNSKSGQEIAATGPTVLDAKTSPATFDLNSNMDPVTRTQVIASVKDFQNRVTDVRVRFLHVPLEIPM